MSIKLLPCPFCGTRHDCRNIRFTDVFGDFIGDLQTIHDFEHVRDPSNAAWPEDWERMSEEDRAQVSKVYLESIDGVDRIGIVCACCGAYHDIEAGLVGFPEEGWAENFRIVSNARSLPAMEVAMKYAIDELSPGPVRSQYQAVLDALQAIPEVIKEDCDQAEEDERWLDMRGDDDDF